jgi:hypothetical protein
MRRLLELQSYPNVFTVCGGLICGQLYLRLYPLESVHYDTIVVQVIVSRTAPLYCILLNVHCIVSFYITVPLYVRSTVY